MDTLTTAFAPMVEELERRMKAVVESTQRPVVVEIKIPPSLPSEGLVDVEAVLEHTGIGKTSWYKGVKAGLFAPPACRFGTKPLWDVADVRKAIATIKSGACEKEETSA